jgi:hypothetical protein
MDISNTILEELNRYRKINNYISEQAADLPTVDVPPADVPPVPGGDVPPAPEGAPPAEPGATPTPAGETAEPIDVANDPDVEKIGEEEDSTEELEITDLVKSQQNIESKQEEYFNNLFGQLSNLEQKLSEMDNVMSKLNELEAKIEKYRPKTPEEKLELRSIDSGPFNQKLTDFFTDKQSDMEKSGKNEYVLTTDEVEDYTPAEIKGTFNNYGEEGDFKELKY